ncbi:uncharacterized protein [Ptychodera flava]|uniref:uncharacterized protein n=1 Tax=Ptychodera flava TaxID=63121 RepID=UPI00396A8C82
MKLFAHVILYTIVLCCFDDVIYCSPQSTAPSWSKFSFPNPQVDTEICSHHGNESWLCDPEKILTAEQAAEIEEVLEETQNLTTCDCHGCVNETDKKFIVTVAIVPKIYLLKSLRSVTEQDLETVSHEFADYLLAKYQYGKCGNDVVLFVSRDDRQFSVAIGSEAKKFLTSRSLLKIRSEISVHFQTGKVYEGVLAAVTIFKDVFLLQYEYSAKVSFVLMLIFVGIGTCAGLFVLTQFYNFHRQKVLAKPKHERIVCVWGFV